MTVDQNQIIKYISLSFVINFVSLWIFNHFLSLLCFTTLESTEQNVRSYIQSPNWHLEIGGSRSWLIDSWSFIETDVFFFIFWSTYGHFPSREVSYAMPQIRLYLILNSGAVSEKQIIPLRKQPLNYIETDILIQNPNISTPFFGFQPSKTVAVRQHTSKTSQQMGL